MAQYQILYYYLVAKKIVLYGEMGSASISVKQENQITNNEEGISQDQKTYFIFNTSG